MTNITAKWLSSGASQTVCNMLLDAGHQAWFVGGCVRNALLDAPVADLDLSTDAHPETVIALAKRAGLKVIPTGIDHGTVTVVVSGMPYEITTFRRDVETDGRRAVVAFATTMQEDALRRDFTMNALYAGSDGVVVDPLGGLPDLEARRVRFIEDAAQRIKEDYLRILRFFRFHAWYGDVDAGIDPDGLAACAAHVEGLQELSKERIGQELIKLLLAPDTAPAMASLAATGALAQILPGARAAHLSVLVHIEDRAGLKPDAMRRLAVIGGMNVTENLRLSKAEAGTLAILTSGDDTTTLAYRKGAQIAVDAMAVQAAVLGHEIDSNKVKLAYFAETQTCPISASDLMPTLSGAALGEALKKAEARWIASGFTLTKDQLLD
jgi:poly(A) polymerase